MQFIQVDQDFVVETDSSINNTGADIMGETGENTVPLPKSSKRSMTLVDTENNSAGEDYFPPLKRFQTCSRNMNGVSRWICFLIFQNSSIVLIPDAELEDSILKYNPIPSNVLPPAPLDEFLRGVFGRKS